MVRKYIPMGTFINVLAVLAGSFTGLGLKQFFTDAVQLIVFQAVGLGTILIGMKMMWKLPEGFMLKFMFSLILGGIAGVLLGLDQRILEFSDFLKLLTGNQDQGFSEGLVTAFLLFCIGSMTIVGSLEEGISGNRDLIMVKSLMDGFASIALASTYGIGVAFSVIPMLIFQGGLTVMARRIKGVFTPYVTDALSAVGGALIIGISINLLKLGDIALENLLPSLLFCVMFASFFSGKRSI
jgi:uncharacterized membrane protein YqgA involved in biofilm formation